MALNTLQFFLPGTQPLFWKQISSLSTGIYNKENQQSAAANIDQTMVAFIDKPAGTLVNIVMNGNLQGQATVLDNTGLVYLQFPLPYSKSEDIIEVSIHDAVTGDAIVSEAYATSHILSMFEIQADSFTPMLARIAQLEQNNSIDGVEDGLLENKYGVFTGVGRRNEQTIDQYRKQTSCLWNAFTFAGTEAGLTKVLQCVLKDGADLTVSTTIVATRDVVGNRIFDDPQFYPVNPPQYPPTDSSRVDPDTPHFYIADIAAQYYPTGDYPVGSTPIDVLAPDPAATGFNPDNVKQFTIHTNQAVGNEVIVSVGISEQDASSIIPDEVVLKRSIGDDQLGNHNILPFVMVTSATIGGVPAVLLPQQDVDFTVDPFTGIITWTGPLIPDDNTTYRVTYPIRLDDTIRAAVSRIKPTFRKIVIQFGNVTSGLPKAISI